MPTDKVLVTRDNLDLLANAIASKASVSVPMTIDGMISAVNGISGGGGNEDAIVQRTLSGFYSNDTISQVGSWAFYNNNTITGISFPSVTRMGYHAFDGCSSLTSVYMPLFSGGIDNVEPTYAFANCDQLSYASFPNTTSIFGSMFHGDIRLREAHFSSATTVGAYAFYNCQRLSVVDLPNVNLILGNAFYSCNLLKSFNGPNVTQVAANAFCRANLSQGVSFPILTAIGGNAFQSVYFTEANFPSAIYMDAYAFASCPSLQTISFPSLKSISNCAFSGCSKLTSVVLPELMALGTAKIISDTSYYTVTAASYVFANCSSLSMVSLKKAVGPIGVGAFQNCSALTKIYAPYISCFSSQAFQGCSALTEICFTNIDPYGALYSNTGSYTFRSCYALSRAILGTVSSFVSNLKSVLTLGTSAFANCSALKNVYFLTGNFSIYGTTFYGCSLSGIYLLASSGNNVMTNGSITSSMLGNLTGLSIYIHESKYNAYKTETNWSGISSRMVSLTNAQVQEILNEIIPVIPDD